MSLRGDTDYGHSASIKEDGVLLNEISSEILSQCAKLRVCLSHRGAHLVVATSSRKYHDLLTALAVRLMCFSSNSQQQTPGSSEEDRGRTLTELTTGRESQVSLVLEKIANDRHLPMTSIALAYVMHKVPYVFPIVGGRKVSHLRSNVAALSVVLSDDEMSKIDTAYNFEVGFPHNVNSGDKLPRGPGDLFLTQIRGSFDFVEAQKPISPQGKGKL